ncbi:MAG TPA: hypothetical protein VET85_01990 [Stellaceae bacterium]|nr:hypothetical protein [Stellaceae bacterium]
MPTYTFVHVALSLMGIGSGLAVLGGLLAAHRLDGWTTVFFTSLAATDVTGFGFPIDRLLPSHIVGIVSLALIALACLARYALHLRGAWRWIYALAAVVALYLDVFVLLVQAFLKVPALHALAPTQTEPPFLLTQLVVLALFVLLAVAAAIKFRPRRELAM